MILIIKNDELSNDYNMIIFSLKIEFEKVSMKFINEINMYIKCWNIRDKNCLKKTKFEYLFCGSFIIFGRLSINEDKPLSCAKHIILLHYINI